MGFRAGVVARKVHVCRGRGGGERRVEAALVREVVVALAWLGLGLGFGYGFGSGRGF